MISANTASVYMVYTDTLVFGALIIEQFSYRLYEYFNLFFLFPLKMC